MKRHLFLFLSTSLALCSCGGPTNSSSLNNSDGSNSNDSSDTSSDTTSDQSDNSESSEGWEYKPYKPETAEFDEENIVLRAPVFSDEHCERTSPINSSVQTTNSIKKFTELVGRTDFDLWLSTGDRSLTGTLAADQEWLNAYEAGCEGSSNNLFFCHGNHDVYWSGCASRQEHYDFFNTKGIYNNDEDDGQPETGNRHRIVNGFDFIAIDITTYDGKTNPISLTTTNWARKILNKCDKTKPVFVLAHATAKNTIIGSCDDQADGVWGSSQALYDIVKDYPNVILFTGHTHYEGHDERNIWQGDFTSINVPTLAGGMVMDTYFNGIFDPLYTEDSEGNRTYKASGVINGFPETEDPKYSSSQGLYLEVDSHNNTRITRYDLKHGVQMKNPWIISAPKEDKSHLETYSERSQRRYDFGPHANGNVETRFSNGSLEVSFDAFKHDDMVMAYEVQTFVGKEIKDIGDFDIPVERNVFYADYYKNYPESSSYVVSFTKLYSSGTIVRVIALDSWGKYSMFYAKVK